MGWVIGVGVTLFVFAGVIGLIYLFLLAKEFEH
jgi:hypothetical protein